MKLSLHYTGYRLVTRITRAVCTHIIVETTDDDRTKGSQMQMSPSKKICDGIEQEMTREMKSNEFG